MAKHRKKSPGLDYEIGVGHPTILVAGADEVGRGCLAGPVVAGAVVLPSQIDFKKDPWLLKIQDSKVLNSRTREELAPLISKWAVATGIGVVTVEEIDRLNIFHASLLAIVRAVDALKLRPAHVLVDGKFLPKTEFFSLSASAIVKGDSKCLSIAAASILAKVWRDQHMLELDGQYPGYELARHKGYPTEAHTRALKKIGICEIHRRSFKTISEMV